MKEQISSVWTQFTKMRKLIN